MKRLKDLFFLLWIWPVLMVICAFSPDWNEYLGATHDD